MRRCLALAFLSLFLCTSLAFGQDEGQVLRLSVGFRTLKNSATLDDTQRQEVARLEASARTETSDKKYGEALRSYYHAMAVIRKQPWTPARALSSALQFKADKVVLEPGSLLKLQLSQSFQLEEPLASPLSGSLTLDKLSKEKPEIIKELKPLSGIGADFSSRPVTIEAAVPEVPDGRYGVSLSLQPEGSDPIVRHVVVYIGRGVTTRATELKARIARVKTTLESQQKSNLLAELPAVEYSASVPDLANAGAISLERSDPKAELDTASNLLDQLERGTDPLALKRIDFRWAYRSDVDGEIQPYRVYLPRKYTSERKFPLIVALHGMGGDEDSYFNAYDNGVIKRLAEQRGYIVVCPKGRNPASMYQGSAEKDVMDVIAEARRLFSVDADRIYLTGHSMGGYGTWSIGVAHPEVFAALAPVSGGGLPQVYAQLAKIKNVPAIVIHGDHDPTVSVEESRRMVQALQKLGAEVKYIEVPGGNHVNVVAPTMPDVFNFFDAHKKESRGAAKAAASTR
jgi:predicted esterase